MTRINNDRNVYHNPNPVVIRILQLTLTMSHNPDYNLNRVGTLWQKNSYVWQQQC